MFWNNLTKSDFPFNQQKKTLIIKEKDQWLKLLMIKFGLALRSIYRLILENIIQLDWTRYLHETLTAKQFLFELWTLSFCKFPSIWRKKITVNGYILRNNWNRKFAFKDLRRKNWHSSAWFSNCQNYKLINSKSFYMIYGCHYDALSHTYILRNINEIFS